MDGEGDGNGREKEDGWMTKVRQKQNLRARLALTSDAAGPFVDSQCGRMECDACYASVYM